MEFFALLSVSVTVILAFALVMILDNNKSPRMITNKSKGNGIEVALTHQDFRDNRVTCAYIEGVRFVPANCVYKRRTTKRVNS